MPHLEWRPVTIGPDPRSPAITTSVTAEEAERLGKLAAGRRVIEVGTAYGYSAIVMALGGAEHVTTIDTHASLPTREVMQANLTAYGVASRVRVIVEDSADALRWLAASQYGLVFIDGDHLAESVRRDVELALPLVEPGGILAVHDYGEDCVRDVQLVLDELFPGGPDEVTVTLWQKTLS